MMSWFGRCIGLLSLAVLLVLPASVFAADGPPPLFYVYMDMGDYIDLVEIDTTAETATQILSIAFDEPLRETTLEAFSSLEWLAFQDALPQIPAEEQAQIVSDMSAPGLNVHTEAVWQDHAGNFVIERHVSKCFSVQEEGMPPTARCYGAIEFSLLDRTTQQERVLWSLPYHAQQEVDPNGCYTTALYENYSGHFPVDQVLMHPTRNLMVVRMWSFGGCAHRAFVLDYSAADLVVQEIADVVSLAWSPDAESLAYVDQTDCQMDVYVCTYTYGTLALAALEKVPFKEAQQPGNADVWVAWPTPETLVYSVGATDGDVYIQNLVWYNQTTGEEAILALSPEQYIYRAITLHDGDQALVLGSGDLGFLTNPSIALDETPGMLLSEDAPIPVESFSANRAYAIASPLDENTVRFIDAEFNIHTVDMTPYEERYGGTLLQLAIVGVEQP